MSLAFGQSSRNIAWAAVLVSTLTAGGALLGLLRDLVLATYFGASQETDAFLVAWMVPETAVPLLVGQALPLLLVPLFTRELHKHGNVGRIIDATLLPLILILSAVSALLAVGAPWIVPALAPGLGDVTLATACLRIASITVLCLGLSGYMMAVLRAHDRFVLPALLNIVFNVGIIISVVTLRGRLGLLSAAFGLVAGSALVLITQSIGFFLVTGRPRLSRAGLRSVPWSLAALLPVTAYSLGRHAQLYVERFIGSTLEPGVISHLNYAQKIGQLPMTLATALTVVALPALVRAAEAGEDRLRGAVQGHVQIATLLVAPAIAFLVVAAPEVVEVLFQRGAFHETDTTATAGLLRIYVLGVLGQTLVAVLVMPYFSTSASLWTPGWITLVGLAVVAGVSVAALPWLGAGALPAGNAIGISVMAILLILRLSHGVTSLDLAVLASRMLRCVAAACIGALLAFLVLRVPMLAEAPAIVEVFVSGIVVILGYVIAGVALRIKEFSLMLTWVFPRHCTDNG